MKQYGVWITHKDGTCGKWISDLDHGLDIWTGSREAAEYFAQVRQIYYRDRTYEVREITKTDMALNH